MFLVVGKPERFDVDSRDLNRGASAEQRLLAAVHRRYRTLGGSPSYRELSLDTGIAVKDIGRGLRQLERRGDVQLQPGRARGILLVRRGAGLSDAELELEARARGAAIVWPAMPELSIAFPVDEQGTDCGGDFTALLLQIDAAVEEKQCGAGEAVQDEGDPRGACGSEAPPRHR